MGVDVEGEDSSTVEGRIDRKPLADVVAGWIWNPGVVKMLRLSPGSVEALRRVDMSAFADSPLWNPSDRGKIPQDMWQDPKRLRTALEELGTIFQGIRSSPFLMKERESGAGSDHFDRDSLELGAYAAGIEDAIKVCDWAATLGKRVKIVLA